MIFSLNTNFHYRYLNNNYLMKGPFRLLGCSQILYYKGMAF